MPIDVPGPAPRRLSKPELSDGLGIIGDMSGFDRSGAFTLTATKADYWHGRHCSQAVRTAEELTQLVETHVLPAGFHVVARPSPFAVSLQGPGLNQRSTNELYEALSGKPSSRRSRH